MTIQNFASFEADTTRTSATSKLVKAWEAKNAKRAVKASGATLMALSLSACGGSDDVVVDITSDNADAILAAVVAVDAGALTVQDVADRAQESGIELEAQATIDAINDEFGTDFAVGDDVADIFTAIAESDNDGAISVALRDAAAELGVTGTSTMTNAELITAIKVANDEAIASGVDLTTNDADAISEAVAASTAFDTLAELVAAYEALANPAAVTLDFTTGVDVLVGTANDDTVNAVLGAGGTLSVVDTLDAGLGNDTLNITDITGATAMINTINITGIDVVNVRSVGDVSNAGAAFDLSDLAAGTVNITQATNVVLSANAASDVNITSTAVTGNITIDGGDVVTVNTDDATMSVAIGGTTGPAGAIDVTHSNATTGNIDIDGGTTVDVDVDGQTTGQVLVGVNTAATGNVVITNTGADVVAATSVALGAVSADTAGNITITSVATLDDSAVAEDVAAGTATFGITTATAGASTASVTVVQDAAVGPVNYTAAVTDVIGTSTITFVAATANQTVTVGGLTFTATAAMTAEEVADVFAGLSDGDVVGNAAGGVGTFAGTLTNFSLGEVVEGGTTAAPTYSVVATGSTSAAGNIAAATGTATPTTAVVDTAVVGNDAIAGVYGITNGQVVVAQDGAHATDALTTVTLTAYGTGSTVDSDVLTTLNLTDSAADVTVSSASTGSVTANLDGITGTVDLDGGLATVTGLVINSTGTASASAVTAAGVTDLTVNATADMTLTGSTFTLAETVTVTGAGDVVLAGTAGALTSVNASAATGDVDMSAVTVTAAGTLQGGAGDDSATVAAGTTAANTFGAGNDTVTVSALGADGSVDGGAGTADVLVMAGADAAAASASAAFNTAVTGFEILELGIGAAAVDLDNLTYDYVVSGAVAGAATLTNAAANSTLEIQNATGGHSIALADPSGAADAVTIVAAGQDGLNANAPAAALAVGTVTANGIETVNLQSTTADADGALDSTMTLIATAATTVTVSGENGLDLTLDATSALVDTVDAGTMTGGLTVTGLAATTSITGGSGNDVIQSAAANATLIGGAGDDTIILNATGTVSDLTGGAGNDTFTINVAVDSTLYSTITDLSSGDILDMGGAPGTFGADAITLAGNATFAEYLDAAAEATAQLTHFQFGGNTYVVNDAVLDAPGTGYIAGDAVIEISGLVDLSTASFNTGTGDLFIA